MEQIRPVLVWDKHCSFWSTVVMIVMVFDGNNGDGNESDGDGNDDDEDDDCK